jgi:hypothetical protein
VASLLSFFAMQQEVTRNKLKEKKRPKRKEKKKKRKI